MTVTWLWWDYLGKSHVTFTTMTVLFGYYWVPAKALRFYRSPKENGGGKGGRGGGKGKGGEEKKRKIEDSYLRNSIDACLGRTYLVYQT